jgi:anti-sigma regulatory factor (Ser/Thr protein kinase)
MALELRLSPGPRAPAEARRYVDERFDRLDPDSRARLLLLVSELVSNSVRHAGLGSDEEIRLTVRERPDVFQVSVTDPGGGFRPRSRELDPLTPTGWGLFLVDHLAERWGVRADDGTTVWFEVCR